MLLHQLPRLSFSLSLSSNSIRTHLYFSPTNSIPFFSTLYTHSKSKPTSFPLSSSISIDTHIKVPHDSPLLDDTHLKKIPHNSLPVLETTPNALSPQISSGSDDDTRVGIRQESAVFEDTRVEIPLEKLFIPPEVDVSALKTPLSSRILKGSNIVLSNYARDAQIAEAEFVKSSKKKEECPSDGIPEFALVGRSNVGKSSLLNSLVRRKKLALTSKKPGKTQCINHFRINNSWYLVDLPGYGYAAAPHEVRTDWSQFTRDYFLHRETLVSVFLLIDASIPAKKIDLEYASWLGQNQIPMTLVFTKCDKRKKKRNGGKRAEENVENFQNLIREFFQAAPPWIMTSSVTNQGRDEMLLHMAQLRNYWLKH